MSHTILKITDFNLAYKRVLIRVDFNVPLDAKGAISDDTRIRAALPTIEYALQNKAKVILISHFGRPKGKDPKASLKVCAKRLSELLNIPVLMADDCIGSNVEQQVAKLNSGEVILLENVRFYEAEESPEKDSSFAKQLATLGDIYINDAFGCAHRSHSSTTTIAQYFPKKAGVGFLMEKELEFLGKTIENPKRPFYAIIGGSKVSTKLGVLYSLLNSVDALFIGGAMAYTFLKTQNIILGKSFIEANMLEQAQDILHKAKQKNISIYLPEDLLVSNEYSEKGICEIISIKDGVSEQLQGMGIGPKTVQKWCEALKSAKTIIWNGPVSVFEFPQFAESTFQLARFIASLKNCTTIAGGGDIVSAIEQAKVASQFSHVSTGGGASLEFIENRTLPGIEALKFS